MNFRKPGTPNTGLLITMASPRKSIEKQTQIPRFENKTSNLNKLSYFNKNNQRERKMDVKSFSRTNQISNVLNQKNFMTQTNFTPAEASYDSKIVS